MSELSGSVSLRKTLVPSTSLVKQNWMVLGLETSGAVFWLMFERTSVLLGGATDKSGHMLW